MSPLPMELPKVDVPVPINFASVCVNVVNVVSSAIVIATTVQPETVSLASRCAEPACPSPTFCDSTTV